MMGRVEEKNWAGVGLNLAWLENVTEPIIPRAGKVIPEGLNLPDAWASAQIDMH